MPFLNPLCLSPNAVSIKGLICKTTILVNTLYETFNNEFLLYFDVYLLFYAVGRLQYHSIYEAYPVIPRLWLTIYGFHISAFFCHVSVA